MNSRIHESAAAWDASIVAIATGENDVSVWSSATGAFICCLAQCLWSPGGKRLAVSRCGDVVATASWEEGLGLYCGRTGLAKWLRSDLRHIHNVCISNDGAQVLICLLDGPSLSLATEDGKTIGRLRRAEGLFTFPVTSDYLQWGSGKRAVMRNVNGAERFRVHMESLACISAAASDTLVVISEARRDVRAFRRDDGRPAWRYVPPTDHHVRGLQFSPSLGGFAFGLWHYSGVGPGGRLAGVITEDSGQAQHVHAVDPMNAVVGFCNRGCAIVGAHGEIMSVSDLSAIARIGRQGT